MKNKIALATAAMVAGSSLSTAEIVINDWLSFEGFIDMSYTHTDTDVGYSPDGIGGGFGGEETSDNSSSYAVDQVEISWLFDFDPVTAQIDLQYDEGTESGTAVEQAFATYHLDNGVAITAGLYQSMLGFEAFEPTGLYQYSTAYSWAEVGPAIGIGYTVDYAYSILPEYAQGVKVTYETDTSFYGLSIQDEAFENGNGQLGGNNGESTYAVEAAAAFDLGNGLGVFVGGVYEDSEVEMSDSWVFNAYATFETGAWIFAAEVNVGEFEGGNFLVGAVEEFDYDTFLPSNYEEEEVIQALAMANFAYSDAASVTARYSYSEHEIAGASAEFSKFTLAHGYAFTDNLFLVNEVSFFEGDYGILGDNIDLEGVFGAIELIYSF